VQGGWRQARVAIRQPGVDATSRFVQKENGLHLDLMKAQRIYNLTKGPHSWPHPMVVKLTGVEHAAP
jgi:alpha-L-fucosidase